MAAAATAPAAQATGMYPKLSELDIGYVDGLSTTPTWPMRKPDAAQRPRRAAIFVNGVGWEQGDGTHEDKAGWKRVCELFGDDTVFVHNRAWSKETLQRLAGVVEQSKGVAAAAGAFMGLAALAGGRSGRGPKHYLLPLVRPLIGAPAADAAERLLRAVAGQPAGQAVTVVVHSHGAMVLNAAVARRADWARVTANRSVELIVLGAPVRVSAPGVDGCHQYAHPADVVGCLILEADVPLSARSVPGVTMLPAASTADPIASHRLVGYLDHLERHGLHDVGGYTRRPRTPSPPPTLATTAAAAANGDTAGVVGSTGVGAGAGTTGPDDSQLPGSSAPVAGGAPSLARGVSEDGDLD